MFQVEASKSLFQSGSLKSSASGSSRATTDNLNHSVHLPPAAPVHADPSTLSPRRFLDRDGGKQYSADWYAGGDTEDAVRDEWDHSNNFTQFARGPKVDLSHHGKLLYFALV